MPESGIHYRPDSGSASALAAMRRGDAFFLAERHEDAAREFVHALDALEGHLSPLTVDVYLRLGRANQALGRVTACLHSYKKALEADPEHAPTLRALAELHLEWNEVQAADRVERRLFTCAGSAEERAAELIRSGDRWWKRAQDPERAKRRYRKALLVTPRSLGAARQRILARLRAISSATNRSELVSLENRVRDARTAQARAEALFELGAAAWFEAHDHREATRAFESAFAVDRSMIAAVEMLAGILIERRDHARLEAICRSLAGATDAEGVAARATIREALRCLPRGKRTSQVRRRTLASFERPVAAAHSEKETG